jgi:hypothetical protein
MAEEEVDCDPAENAFLHSADHAGRIRPEGVFGEMAADALQDLLLLCDREEPHASRSTQIDGGLGESLFVIADSLQGILEKRLEGSGRFRRPLRMVSETGAHFLLPGHGVPIAGIGGGLDLR